MDISSTLLSCAEGSAFQRWLAPGLGETRLDVQCELRKGEEVVGTAKAVRTVATGGVWSVGAGKSVFEDVAKDLVDDLRKRISGEI